jgi:adenylate cyclase
LAVVEVQRGMAERNVGSPPEKRIEFRVGINLSDVIAEEHDIFGDGVNVAARLETLAEPGGICVSRVVRDQVRDKVAFTFEDLGEQQVKNIARPVRVYRFQEPTAAARSPSASETPALPLPDKPSIAVLPFANMSGDPEQEYFADGMVEEIITALSRIRWLYVIARNSSFTDKGHAVDVKQVGRELGVRYVLEGSVQGRRAGADHRPADRRGHWDASLGRPLRRFARRCLRPSGQGGDQCRRHHRTDPTGCRGTARC